MAHFAELDAGNIVKRIIVINNEVLYDENNHEIEELGINFCKTLLGENTVWKQTSYNNSFRKNYAGIGFTYDPIMDAFIPPQPYNSWTLDQNTGNWKPPVSYPDDILNSYYWDEDTISWLQDISIEI
jgi:hypothetical protein